MGDAPALGPFAFGPEVGVQTCAGDEVGVGAVLHDRAVIEDEDLVGSGDRRQVVADDQHGSAFRQCGQAGVDGDRVLRIERCGDLVEKHDGRVLEEGSRDGDALTLSARERDSGLADLRVEAVGHPVDDLVDAGQTDRLAQFVVSGLRVAETDVGLDRVIEQVDVLLDHRELLHHGLYRQQPGKNT